MYLTVILTVTTKVGTLFLNLIKMHFPTDSKLSKIFNNSIVKLSYTCLPNMKNFVNAHNHKIFNKINATSK